LCLVSFSEKSFNAPENTDKIVHFTFYFILTTLMIRSKIEIKNKDYLLIIAIAVCYGIIIEVLQGVLTETRKPDFNDVLANSTGVVVAVLLNKYVYKRISLGKFKI
jgi:VanZ family protein